MSLFLSGNAAADNVFERIARALADANRNGRDSRDDRWRNDDSQWQDGRQRYPDYVDNGPTVFRGRRTSDSLSGLAESSARIVEDVFASSGIRLQGRPDEAMARGFRNFGQGVRAGEDPNNLSQRWTQVENDWIQVRPLVQQINTRQAWVAIQEIDGNMAQMRSMMNWAPSYAPPGYRPNYGSGNRPSYGYGTPVNLNAISELYQFALNLRGVIQSGNGRFVTENDRQLATQQAGDFSQWIKVVLDNAQAGHNQDNLRQPFDNATQVWRQLAPLLDSGSANYGQHRPGYGSLRQYRVQGDSLLARASQSIGR